MITSCPSIHLLRYKLALNKNECSFVEVSINEHLIQKVSIGFTAFFIV